MTLGDAELDEGNIFEALLEGWKHDVRNLWWIIDYNRQSLDAVIRGRLEAFGRTPQRFGLVHVDYDALVRTPKQSARWYAQVTRRNGLLPA